MRTVPILITLLFTSEHLASIKAVSDRLNVRIVHTRTPEGVAAALNKYPDTEVLYAIAPFATWQTHWQLRWIQLHWAGIDHISLNDVPRHIQLTTASGIHSVVLAEHTFALLLALRRRISTMIDLQHQKLWPRNRGIEFSQPLLRGQTIGILGYGSIGREIARLAQAFGMRVLAYKRNPNTHIDIGFTFPGIGDPNGIIPATYFGPENLYDLLRESDVLVNILPATPETEGLFDSHAFQNMKPAVLFINVGRGRTVNEEALVKALDNNLLAGVGLDVFNAEPLAPKSPLWHFENVIISPHVGGRFPQYYDLCVKLFYENLARYLTNQPLWNMVDHTAKY